MCALPFNSILPLWDQSRTGGNSSFIITFFCLSRPLVENGVHVDLKQGRGAPWGRGEEGGDGSFVGRAYFTNLLSGKQRSQECWHGDIWGRGRLHCQGVWGWADSSLFPTHQSNPPQPRPLTCRVVQTGRKALVPQVNTRFPLTSSTRM